MSVTDTNGARGWIAPSDPIPAATPYVLAHDDEGIRYSVPRDLLVALSGGGYALSGRFADHVVTGPVAILLAAGESASARPSNDAGGTRRDPERVLPVLAETLVVSTRPAIIGRVRLTKRVHNREQSVDQTVEREQVEVERIVINRVVDTAPPVRYDGDTMVIPVLEEVVVVEKRLMLREELRVSTRRVQQRINETVTVRSEAVTVERFDRDGRRKTDTRE